MNDYATLARLIENLIRFGVIEEIDHGQPEEQRQPRVRVRTGKLLTGWLPWATPRAGEDREWNPPTIGEQVLLLAPSGQLANGVAVFSLPSELIPANGARPGLHRRTYRDGAVIEYDSIAHKLTATIPGDIEVSAEGTIAVTAVGNITVTSQADITIAATGKVKITGSRVDLN